MDAESCLGFGYLGVSCMGADGGRRELLLGFGSSGCVGRCGDGMGASCSCVYWWRRGLLGCGQLLGREARRRRQLGR